MADTNQTPEQLARDNIDAQLEAAGWKVQHNKKIDFNAGLGIAVREYQTDAGPADYVLFIDKKAVGVIEAKPESWGHKITTVEEQSGGYAGAKLKWVNNKEPLPFIYESTGVVTHLTNGLDPKPRARDMFTFHQPKTLQEWMEQGSSLLGRLQHLPPLNYEGLRRCQVMAIENLEASFKLNKPRAPFKWRRVQAKPTRPLPPCIGCSSMPMPSASCFWLIPKTLANRPRMIKRGA
jgi:type I restriction enzyme R subunit